MLTGLTDLFVNELLPQVEEFKYLRVLFTGGKIDRY